MTYKTILVHVDAMPDADWRVTAAVGLAERFGAHLIGLTAGTPQPPIVDPMTGIVAADWMEIQQTEIREDFKTAEVKFRGLATGIRSEWRAVFDTPSLALADAASATDLIVVGAEPAGFRWNPTRIMSVGDLLMSAGRPVLVLPAKAAPGNFGNVVVAWKDRREARRAVADALPFLKIAKRVDLVHVAEGDDDDALTADVAGYLARHQVSVHVASLDAKGGPAEDQVLAICEKAGADLIVAGAFGHSRLREWAFGGVTRRLLTQSTIASLFSH